VCVCLCACVQERGDKKNVYYVTPLLKASLRGVSGRFEGSLHSCRVSLSSTNVLHNLHLDADKYYETLQKSYPQNSPKNLGLTLRQILNEVEIDLSLSNF